MKPIIDITLPLDELVDVSEHHLGDNATVFQKDGELVNVIQKNNITGIRPLRCATIRYILSKTATWNNGDKSCHPPHSIASCLVEKGEWQYIKLLRAVINFPALSSSGKLQMTPGYDAETKAYYVGDTDCNIPEHPTLDQVKKATDILLDIVCDFPFASMAHRSAWIAALLSPLARFAHEGNSPIIVVQANVPRVGKTRLVKLISYIVTGQECAVITHTKNEEEERKRILSYLRSARTMVLVDNVVGQYGGATINALATSRSFEDRVLGNSKIMQAMNDTIWLITGNQIELASDTSERCLHVRLACNEERPQLRTNFKYPDLFAVARIKRQELLEAALTILKGYMAAGSPRQDIPAWGSFEEWSNLVRGAIVWAGLPDPAITRSELEQEADVAKHAIRALVEGWYELQCETNKHSLTTREAYHLLAENQAFAPHLRYALEEISGVAGKLPPAHTIGRHLREAKNRNISGKMLRCEPDEKSGHKWFVELQNKTEGQEGIGGQDMARFDSEGATIEAE